MERQILSLKKKKVLLVWNIYINDGMAKDLTDLSDFKITFIIIIYSLSLLLITNCNKERKKEGSPQASHPGNWALVAALFFPATSCLSTHRLFPAGTEQTVSSGLCLSVCMVFLMGAFRGTELPFAEHPQQTLGSEPFRPDYISETPPPSSAPFPISLHPLSPPGLGLWVPWGARQAQQLCCCHWPPQAGRVLALSATSSPVATGKSVPS